MWRCSQCQETALDEFCVCWSCGRIRDNRVDTTLEEPEEVQPEEEEPDDEIEYQPRAPLPEPSFPAMSRGGMNRREIATIACRAIALILLAQVGYFLLTAIWLLGGHALTSSGHGGSFDSYGVVAVTIFGLPLLGGAVLAVVYWVKSPAIAARMVPGDPTPVTRISFDVRDATIVAYSMAGLFILLDGLREFVSVMYMARQYGDTSYEMWTLPQAWRSLAQVTLALGLIFGSRGIVSLIDRVRTAWDTKSGDEISAKE